MCLLAEKIPFMKTSASATCLYRHIRYSNDDTSVPGKLALQALYIEEILISRCV